MSVYTEEQYKRFCVLYRKSGSFRQIDRIDARIDMPKLEAECGEIAMKAMHKRAIKEIGE